MTRLVAALAAALFLLAAADVPPIALPGFDQIATLGPTGLLAVGFWLMATGRITPGMFTEKADARAEAAIAAAAQSAAALEKNTAAIAALAQEHAEERREWTQALARQATIRTTRG